MPVPDTALASFRVRRRGLGGLGWRTIVLVVVFGMALAAFRLGVGASDREGVQGADFAAHVYYSLGLFVLGGLDLGTPIGGPFGGRLLLWSAYFLAPAITTSALVEAVLRAVGQQRFRLRLMRNHSIVVGCGRLGLLYLRALRLSGDRDRILLVEKNESGAHLNIARSRYDADAVLGDITQDGLLEALRVHKAKSVTVLTGDDFVNLDAAARFLEHRPQLAGRVMAHVSDSRLLLSVRERDLVPGCRVFNSHARAAKNLVAEMLLPRFRETAEIDAVVLVGFGRFGQTVLRELQLSARHHFHTVAVIDPAAGSHSGVFEEMVGFDPALKRILVEGDVRDPASLRRIAEEGHDVDHAVYVVGTHDPSLNLRTSLGLRRRHPEAFIVARCFNPSHLTRQISKDGHFEVVATSELLLQSLCDDGILCTPAE